MTSRLSKPAAPVLSVRDLSKGFEVHHLGSRLAAFAGIDFDLHAGEFLLLRGPNGVGKSTLLRTLYRSYLPVAGSAMFQSSAGPIDLAHAADVDIAWLRRHDIGFVTQFLTARPRVSAEDLVAEPLRLAGQPQAAALAEARRWLATFGVKPALWPAYPTTFSGGEQQKVNLARALILPRRLLLLDEPTASLDASARAALVARLTALKAEGVAMIGVFHHPEDVAHLIDHEITLAAPQTQEMADVAE
ncbi:MAG: phosphonate C-P lyase system protein PhnL [Devosia sp.]